MACPSCSALTPRYMEDKYPDPSTRAPAAATPSMATVWPYIFPGTASYWSQAGAAMKYLKDNGAKRGTKIAFLFYDNPAGRDGLPMLEEVARKEGYVLRKYPRCSRPGLEMEPRGDGHARDFKADWVIGSLFNSAALRFHQGVQENRLSDEPRAELRLGVGDADAEAAGWDTAQGYLGLQFAGVWTQLSRHPGHPQDVPR